MSPDVPVETQSGDGLLHIRLQPLTGSPRAMITTPAGVFSGRDHTVIITRMEDLP